jgi:hypothetical protein
MMLLVACGRYFAPDINLKRYATEKEIIGRWSLTARTLALAKRDGYAAAASAQHEIVFHGNGTCDFRSITEFGQNVAYLDAHGSWKLEHDVGLPGETKRKNEVTIRIKDRAIGFFLTEEEGRLLLWNFWGDPDSWEFIKYEKRG